MKATNRFGSFTTCPILAIQTSTSFTSYNFISSVRLSLAMYLIMQMVPYSMTHDLSTDLSVFFFPLESAHFLYLLFLHNNM